MKRCVTLDGADGTMARSRRKPFPTPFMLGVLIYYPRSVIVASGGDVYEAAKVNGALGPGEGGAELSLLLHFFQGPGLLPPYIYIAPKSLKRHEKGYFNQSLSKPTANKE
jgi:hypothetical protein